MLAVARGTARGPAGRRSLGRVGSSSTPSASGRRSTADTSAASTSGQNASPTAPVAVRTSGRSNAERAAASRTTKVAAHPVTQSPGVEVVPLAGTRPPTSAHGRRAEAVRPDLALGNRLPHKNFAGLVRAMALVDPAVRPTLVVTGSRGTTPCCRVVEEPASRPSWVDLKLLGERRGAHELYRHCRRRWRCRRSVDGFCLPALEAMMVGLPAMLSDIPVYHEVGGEARALLDPPTSASIAAAVTRVVTEPALVAQLSAAGYPQAATFSWSAWRARPSQRSTWSSAAERVARSGDAGERVVQQVEWASIGKWWLPTNSPSSWTLSAFGKRRGHVGVEVAHHGIAREVARDDRPATPCRSRSARRRRHGDGPPVRPRARGRSRTGCSRRSRAAVARSPGRTGGR